jgi:hypothetical protein
MLRAELLFGAGEEAGFEGFLDREVTPRFPAGLTVLQAHGRWRTPDGRQTREPSRVVLIVAPPQPDALPALEAIRTAYRQQFHQRSVGLLTSRSCASF